MYIFQRRCKFAASIDFPLHQIGIEEHLTFKMFVCHLLSLTPKDVLPFREEALCWSTSRKQSVYFHEDLLDPMIGMDWLQIFWLICEKSFHFLLSCVNPPWPFCKEVSLWFSWLGMGSRENCDFLNLFQHVSLGQILVLSQRSEFWTEDGKQWLQASSSVQYGILVPDLEWVGRRPFCLPTFGDPDIQAAMPPKVDNAGGAAGGAAAPRSSCSDGPGVPTNPGQSQWQRTKQGQGHLRQGWKGDLTQICESHGLEQEEIWPEKIQNNWVKVSLLTYRKRQFLWRKI